MPRVPLKHDRLPDHDRLEPESLRLRVEQRQIGCENSLKTVGLNLELGLEVDEDGIGVGDGAAIVVGHDAEQ